MAKQARIERELTNDYLDSLFEEIKPTKEERENDPWELSFAKDGMVAGFALAMDAMIHGWSVEELRNNKERAELILVKKLAIRLLDNILSDLFPDPEEEGEKDAS